MIFEIFIELIPPSINQTYKCGKGRFYKSQIAKDWQTDAGMIIGAKAGEIDWQDNSEWYWIDIWVFSMRMDEDAVLKLTQDTLTQKLGFDDKKIIDASIHKRDGKKEGILIRLLPASLTEPPQTYYNQF